MLQKLSAVQKRNTTKLLLVKEVDRLDNCEINQSVVASFAFQTQGSLG